MTEQRTDRSVSLAKLAPGDWQRLLDIADRFEKAWPKEDGADDVDLTSFLPPAGDALRLAVLQELIKTDLEIRWRRGQQPTLETYRQKFPELGGIDALPAKLIYEEYRVRQLYGDRPALSAYQGRFPHQFVELARLIEEQPPPTLTHMGATPSSTELGAKPPPPASSGSLRLTVVGDNKLIKRIGSGGFGEVYRAEAPGGVEVAVKVIYRPLDHEEAQRELQSLELVKGMRHPYLLQTHRFSQQEDRLYIVMELADGSLRDRLKECRAQGLIGIPTGELLTYFREAAEALDFLHGRHVMHRDIKPENILLVGRHVKVADFGLARLQQSQRSATASGSGTPAYMAPEVWRGKVSLNSDQYSLAVAYVEMRLDRRPFAGGDMMELMLAHVQSKPELAPLPQSEQDVICKAMAKDPAERYGSCAEFVHALEQAIAQAGGELPRFHRSELVLPGASGGAQARDSGTELDTPGREAGTLLGGDSRVAAASAAGSQTALDQSLRPVQQAWRQPDRRHDTIIESKPKQPSAVVAVKPARPHGARNALVAILLFLLVGGGTAAALFIIRNGKNKHGGDQRADDQHVVATGSFSLEMPEPVRVQAGNHQPVTFTVKRTGFDGLISITSVKVPSKVNRVAVTLPANASSVAAEIVVAGDATPGRYSIPIEAVGSGVKQTGSFDLIVEQQNVYLPEVGNDIKNVGHWEGVKVPGKFPLNLGNRVFENELDFVFNDDGMRVPFILIPPGDDDLPPFYIMKEKVSNGLFAKFAAVTRVPDNEWREGALGEHKGIIGREDYPVFGVHVEDAWRCAQWLGCDLPTPEEWDKATGLHRDKKTRGEGPFLGPWEKNVKKPEVGVSRPQGPLKNGEATKDVSYYGVRDMAGNGQEWTRQIMEFERTWVPLDPRKRHGTVEVIIRGHSYTDEEPLRFSDLESPTGNGKGVLNYKKASPETSFRMVLEPQQH